MDFEKINVASLEVLVEEMLKPKPCEQTVKSMMKGNGLPYSSDPIERVNLVLRALHFNEGKTASDTGKGNQS